MRVIRISPQGWAKSLGSAGAIVGGASAIGFQFGHVFIGALVFMALTGAFLVYFWRRERDQLGAATDALLDGNDIIVGANAVTIAQSRRIATKMFGNDVISETAIIDLYRCEPRSLVTVRYGGKTIGYTDFFLPTNSTAAKMLAGVIDERDLTKECVLNFDQWLASGEDRYVYFAGVVVEGTPYQRGIALRQLLWGVVRTMLAAVRGDTHNGKFAAFATAWSDQGKQLLSRMGFDETGVQSKLGTIMMMSVDIAVLRNAIAKLPDFSASVRTA